MLGKGGWGYLRLPNKRLFYAIERILKDFAILSDKKLGASDINKRCDICSDLHFRNITMAKV